MPRHLSPARSRRSSLRKKPHGRQRNARGTKDALTEDQIFAWAHKHFRRTGHWPRLTSGLVPESQGLTWNRIHNALMFGLRGLPGRSSLKKLIVSRDIAPAKRSSRQAPNPDQIWKWAQEYHKRTGDWPKLGSGPVFGSDLTWTGVDEALNIGRRRALPSGSALRRLLHSHGVVRRTTPRRPPLRPEQIWKWAKEYNQRTGDWPIHNSGRIPGSDDTWETVNGALNVGCRGLKGGSSLMKFLVSRGVRPSRRSKKIPRLTNEKILKLADAFFKKHRRWPYLDSGRVPGPDRLTWQKIDSALRRGTRGMPGGSSLSIFLRDNQRLKFIGSQRPRREENIQVPLKQIKAWARVHRAATGEWPHMSSGKVISRPGMTWKTIDNILRVGGHGLPRPTSLSELFSREKDRGRKK